MKRVRICSLAVCLVLTLAVLMPVAFADNFGVGSTVFLWCSTCKAQVLFRITSYRQPAGTSSGNAGAVCNTCGYRITRTTKYWGDSWENSGCLVGYFDIVSTFCSFNNTSELAIVSGPLPRSPSCTEYSFFQVVHLGACRAGGSLAGAPLGHSWVETSRTPATCLASGTADYRCSRCNETKTETVSQSFGHNMKESSRTPATCTAAGSIVKVCVRCDYTETETIPVIDHAWREERTEPTCISPGSILSTCSACGLQKTEELPMLGGEHAWAETSRTDATCAAPGSIAYTCSRCQDTKTEPIPQSDQHAWEVAETVPASYDSSGRLVSQGYVLYRCPVCSGTYTTAIGTSPPGYNPIPEGSGGEGMADTTAALGKTFLSAVWRLFGLYVPGFSFTFGQMWVGFFLASVSILVIKLIFGFGCGSCPGDTPRTSSTSSAKISKERRNDEF